MHVFVCTDYFLEGMHLEMNIPILTVTLAFPAANEGKSLAVAVVLV